MFLGLLNQEGGAGWVCSTRMTGGMWLWHINHQEFVINGNNEMYSFVQILNGLKIPAWWSKHVVCYE